MIISFRLLDLPESDKAQEQSTERTIVLGKPVLGETFPFAITIAIRPAPN